MFYTIREYYPHGIEGERTQCTSKEWDSLKKAVAYARRYSYGCRFVRCAVEDEQGNMVFELLMDGREDWGEGYSEDESGEILQDAQLMTETENQHEAACEYTQMVLELPEETGEGDYEVQMTFLTDTGLEGRKLRCQTQEGAILYADTVIKNAGKFVQSIIVMCGELFHWQWHFSWRHPRIFHQQKITELLMATASG